jgi:quercetin dioxygenase-like cupin family protein
MLSIVLALALSAEQKAQFFPAETIKWVQVEPEIFFAPLIGNPSQSAYVAFARFKAGHKLARHTHTAEMRVAVVAGTMYYGLDKEPERKLAPGSFLVIPAGVIHTHRCEAATECTILMEQPDKLDATLVGK